nr:TetR/AcrR family transcriptional regulator [uncultured Sulfurimonas sp.]
MAIIVDKVQKRKDIALSCKEIFIQKGIKDLSVSEVAKAAGIGKGTIYDYFSNKEDIVFEIVNILMQEYKESLTKKIEKATSTREKIKIFSGIFYDKDEFELRSIYKEFISISLSNPSKEMIDFQSAYSDDYYEWFVEILNDGVNSGEIKEGSQDFARGLFVMAKGMFISSSVTNTIDDLKTEIYKFTDSLFDILEVKK